MRPTPDDFAVLPLGTPVTFGVFGGEPRQFAFGGVKDGFLCLYSPEKGSDGEAVHRLMLRLDALDLEPFEIGPHAPS